MAKEEYIDKIEDGRLCRYNIYTGEKQINFEDIRREPLVRPYVLEVADLFCHFVYSGHTHMKAAELCGLPSVRTVQYWMQRHPDFKRNVQEAMRARASFCEEKVLEIANNEEIVSGEVPVLKLRADLYSRVAGWNDPEKYNTNRTDTRHSGGMTIVVDTGIRRESTSVNPVIEEITNESASEAEVSRGSEDT